MAISRAINYQLLCVRWDGDEKSAGKKEKTPPFETWTNCRHVEEFRAKNLSRSKSASIIFVIGTCPETFRSWLMRWIFPAVRITNSRIAMHYRRVAYRYVIGILSAIFFKLECWHKRWRQTVTLSLAFQGWRSLPSPISNI